jgi:hypothetical protein
MPGLAGYWERVGARPVAHPRRQVEVVHPLISSDARAVSLSHVDERPGRSGHRITPTVPGPRPAARARARSLCPPAFDQRAAGEAVRALGFARSQKPVAFLRSSGSGPVAPNRVAGAAPRSAGLETVPTAS